VKGHFYGVALKVRQEVQVVRFCDFINPLYDNLPCASKDRFALEIFSALCGETDPKGANKEYPFSAALPDGLAGDDGTHRKLLFNGNNKKYRGLSSRIREHAIEHQDKAAFIKYCNLSIAETGLNELREAFNVVSTATQDAVFSALFDQFIEFAKSETDDAPNSIPDRADNYLADEIGEPPPITTPLFPGDEFIATECKPITVEHYRQFISYWVITNKGGLTWQGRTLEIVSQQTKGVRALTSKVGIPTLKPKEHAKVEVEYDARHFDGAWELVWEIKDSKGRICFPNKNGLRQTVTVTNRKPS
jgi:hypothetical protein